MHKERFWFGTAMTIVPVLFLLVAISPKVEVTQSGPVEGHVSYKGRPLAGASILFIPEDTRRISWALGCADENGHFVIGSEWHRELLEGKSRFRICVLPDYRGQRGAKRAGAPTINLTSTSPRRWSDPNTTPLKVQLDSGPAQVDITL